MSLDYNPEKFKNTYETDLGKKLWEFLNKDDNKIRMITASELGKPAIEGVVYELLSKFDRKDISNDRTKQMLGHMVRQIMESIGFRLVMSNVFVKHGGLFSRASKYTSDYIEKIDNWKPNI